MRKHIVNIQNFMAKAGQALPTRPTIPDDKTIKLRASLILEEAFETIEALGYSVRLMTDVDIELTDLKLDKFYTLEEHHIAEIADGCADLSVVTIGTLLAFGLGDGCIAAIYEEVDQSNLAKFDGGHEHPETGKWIKPDHWHAPDIKKIIYDYDVLGG